MKSWQDLKLTDDYLFSQIMREEDFCKLFLEMLMGIKVEKVVYLEAQKEVNLFPQAKGIRMDVYLEDDGEIYNIEMQTVKKTNLVKRMRYYHSAIDVDSLAFKRQSVRSAQKIFCDFHLQLRLVRRRFSGL